MEALRPEPWRPAHRRPEHDPARRLGDARPRDRGAFTPRLYLNLSSEVFGLEYEEFDGFLNNTRLNLEHRTFSHLGLGLGLDYFKIDASVENESGRLSAAADYDYIGLVGFVRFF